MHWQQNLDRFELDNNHFLNNQVHSVTTVQLYSFENPPYQRGKEGEAFRGLS
jgi:hypothetical protein